MEGSYLSAAGVGPHGSPTSWARLGPGRVDLVTRFTLAGVALSLLVAVAAASFAEGMLTQFMLAQAAARAVDHVQLGVRGQMDLAEFAALFTPDKLESLTAQLDPLLSRLSEEGSGIIGLHLLSGDGAIVYARQAASRTLALPSLTGPPLGAAGPSVSLPQSPDLTARFGDVIEIYVPLVVDGQVVGAYELYVDGAQIRQMQTLMRGTVGLGWLGLLLPMVLVIGVEARQARTQQVRRARVEAALKSTEERLRQAQKIEAIGLLAGGIAHDFNNLLTVINSFSELVLDQTSPADPRRRLIEEIAVAGEQAAALTGQLLAFSRQEYRAQAVVDLNLVVTDIERLLRVIIGDGVDLVTALAPDLGPVKADPTQLAQVLLNLATNARDAMPTGGQLRIQTGNIELDETVGREWQVSLRGPHVVLEVSDTGVGIDAETREHIFEPFFTTKEAGKGTGLGLATVAEIVKRSEGEIQISSNPGQGTTFRIYLPHSDEASVPPPAVSEAPVAQGSETILLIEDNAAVRALARVVLEASGYTVLEAADSESALRLCAHHPEAIDLLIADLAMPSMSGSEIADRVVALRPRTKVLYMSGYTDDVAVHQAVQAGSVAYLQKPFTPLSLALPVYSCMGC